MTDFNSLVIDSTGNLAVRLSQKVDALRLEAMERGQGIACTAPKLGGDFSSLNADNMTTMRFEQIILPTSAVPVGEVYEFRTQEALRDFMVDAGYWFSGGPVDLGEANE